MAHLQFSSLSLENESNTVGFISYAILRLCSTFVIQSIVGLYHLSQSLFLEANLINCIIYLLIFRVPAVKPTLKGYTESILFLGTLSFLSRCLYYLYHMDIVSRHVSFIACEAYSLVLDAAEQSETAIPF